MVCELFTFLRLQVDLKGELYSSDSFSLISDFYALSIVQIVSMWYICS